MKNKLAHLVSQLTYVNDYRMWTWGSRKCESHSRDHFSHSLL